MKRLILSIFTVSMFFSSKSFSEGTNDLNNASFSAFDIEEQDIDNQIFDEAEDMDLSILMQDPHELEQELLSLEKELEQEVNAQSQDQEAMNMQAIEEKAQAESLSNVSPTIQNFQDSSKSVSDTEYSSQVIEKNSSTEESHIADHEYLINSDKISAEVDPVFDQQSSIGLPRLELQNETSLLEKEVISSDSNTAKSTLEANSATTFVTQDSMKNSSAFSPVNQETVSKQETPTNHSQNDALVIHKIEDSPFQEQGPQSQKKNEIAAVSHPVQKIPPTKMEIDFKEVYKGAPIIYSVLLILSIVSFAIWLYYMINFQSFTKAPENISKVLKHKLNSLQYDEALSLCLKENSILCQMIASGIQSRKYGLNFVLDAMKTEGKRATASFWQRLNLLQDIAIVAPMIGLLGTVLGMFYAFYDLNRSFESISNLFDGLGVSVGTTVAGLIVSIIAMLLHSLAKFRLVKILSQVENEAVAIAHYIENAPKSL